METVRTIQKLETNPKVNANEWLIYSYEVVVVEDNHLTNVILSNALDSTIKKIQSIKSLPVKFSSFHNGSDFISYFQSKDFSKTKLVVFSDYHLEDNMFGADILKFVKSKKSDAIVIIMSDTTNKQIPIDTVNSGAYCFLPKDNKTPVICSELLFQMMGE